MKKKVLAGILAATMAFSMAACGSTGSSSDSGSSAASGSTAKTEEKGEPYTVTMVLQGSQQPDEERIEEKINEILEPELNAKLDIVVLPWASASQQLQLMLSGDEKIDLLYTSATTAVQYMHSGQIMDMSELIDKYGTNLKDIYGEDIAKTNQIDGFVYGVPNQIERALDVTTERNVLRNIIRQRPNKTCIVTTHRPSVLGLCQRVYRVMNGTVTELDGAEGAKMVEDF